MAKAPAFPGNKPKPTTPPSGKGNSPSGLVAGGPGKSNPAKPFANPVGSGGPPSMSKKGRKAPGGKGI